MHTGDVRVAVEDPPALAARLQRPNLALARHGPERHLALADVAWQNCVAERTGVNRAAHNHVSASRDPVQALLAHRQSVRLSSGAR